jgi:hypothetical protein
VDHDLARVLLTVVTLNTLLELGNERVGHLGLAPLSGAVAHIPTIQGFGVRCQGPLMVAP